MEENKECIIIPDQDPDGEVRYCMCEKEGDLLVLIHRDENHKDIAIWMCADCIEEYQKEPNWISNQFKKIQDEVDYDLDDDDSVRDAIEKILKKNLEQR